MTKSFQGQPENNIKNDNSNIRSQFKTQFSQRDLCFLHKKSGILFVDDNIVLISIPHETLLKFLNHSPQPEIYQPSLTVSQPP